MTQLADIILSSANVKKIEIFNNYKNINEAFVIFSTVLGDGVLHLTENGHWYLPNSQFFRLERGSDTRIDVFRALFGRAAKKESLLIKLFDKVPTIDDMIALEKKTKNTKDDCVKNHKLNLAKYIKSLVDSFTCSKIKTLKNKQVIYVKTKIGEIVIECNDKDIVIDRRSNFINEKNHKIQDIAVLLLNSQRDQQKLVKDFIKKQEKYLQLSAL